MTPLHRPGIGEPKPATAAVKLVGVEEDRRRAIAEVDGMARPSSNGLGPRSIQAGDRAGRLL